MLGEETLELPEVKCINCGSLTISESHYHLDCQKYCCGCCIKLGLKSEEKCKTTEWKN